MGGRSGVGGNLDKRGNRGGHVSESAFQAEANRQGMKDLAYDLEDYITSSYGGWQLADKVTQFIENAPASMMYNNGTIYRALYFENKQEFNQFMQQHTQGSTLETRRDGMSWTASKDIANEFASGGDYNVILVNNDTNRLAIGIKNIADTPFISSEEVLYSNRVNFTVQRVERRGNDVYMYVKQKRGKR